MLKRLKGKPENVFAETNAEAPDLESAQMKLYLFVF
jgi:hypothetical protein